MTERQSHSSGAKRARRLAELAAALEDARNILDRLAVAPGASAEISALVERVAEALDEVDSLRRGKIWPTNPVFDPKPIRSSRDWLNRGD